MEDNMVSGKLVEEIINEMNQLKEGIEYWLKSAEETKALNPESDGYFQLWQIQKLLKKD